MFLRVKKIIFVTEFYLFYLFIIISHFGNTLQKWQRRPFLHRSTRHHRTTRLPHWFSWKMTVLKFLLLRKQKWKAKCEEHQDWQWLRILRKWALRWMILDYKAKKFSHPKMKKQTSTIQNSLLFHRRLRPQVYRHNLHWKNVGDFVVTLCICYSYHRRDTVSYSKAQCFTTWPSTCIQDNSSTGRGSRSWPGPRQRQKLNGATRVTSCSANWRRSWRRCRPSNRGRSRRNTTICSNWRNLNSL